MDKSTAEAGRTLINKAVENGFEYRVAENDDGEVIQLHHDCMDDEVAVIKPDEWCENDPHEI